MTRQGNIKQAQMTTRPARRKENQIDQSKARSKRRFRQRRVTECETRPPYVITSCRKILSNHANKKASKKHFKRNQTLLDNHHYVFFYALTRGLLIMAVFGPASSVVMATTYAPHAAGIGAAGGGMFSRRP